MFFTLLACEHFRFCQNLLEGRNPNHPNFYPMLIDHIIKNSPPISDELRTKLQAVLKPKDMRNPFFPQFPKERLEKLSQDCYAQCYKNYYNLRLLYLRCRLHLILKEERWVQRVRGKALLMLSLAKGNDYYTTSALMLLAECEETTPHKITILNEALKLTPDKEMAINLYENLQRIYDDEEDFSHASLCASQIYRLRAKNLFDDGDDSNHNFYRYSEDDDDTNDQSAENNDDDDADYPRPINQ